jgi:hypothetical protein
VPNLYLSNRPITDGLALHSLVENVIRKRSFPFLEVAGAPRLFRKPRRRNCLEGMVVRERDRNRSITTRFGRVVSLNEVGSILIPLRSCADQRDRFWVLAKRDAVAAFGSWQLASIRACVPKPPEFPARVFYLKIKTAAVIQRCARTSVFALESGQPIDGFTGSHRNSDV